MRPGSRMVAFSISFSKTRITKFELRSCMTMRSTLATTTSPGNTSFFPAPLARIFSIMFIASISHGGAGAFACQFSQQRETLIARPVRVTVEKAQAFGARFETDGEDRGRLQASGDLVRIGARERLHMKPRGKWVTAAG